MSGTGWQLQASSIHLPRKRTLSEYKPIHGKESDMSYIATREVAPLGTPYRVQRSEQALLYQIVEQHYPEFSNVTDVQGKPLHLHVEQEFTDYLRCGRLVYGFLRVQCIECHH
jgi:hypothetical protein